ncbi:MAG: ferrous iron transporter B [Clostridiales bacterium]|nr:MAG: ferrous iron transporter B [Clostridiales bacterium]
MGLTIDSTGNKAKDRGMHIPKESGQKIIALAGNPNVGKSTVFNQLTGMKQHTGNWPGKTVSNAWGYCTYQGEQYILADIPGAYSLMAVSAEEEVARDFLCFGEVDAVIVVCDATCLERNLNLVMQIAEIQANVVLCLNLMDEAKKKNIHIDLQRLEQELGISVVGTTARSKKGLNQLMEQVKCSLESGRHAPMYISYGKQIDQVAAAETEILEQLLTDKLNARWTALKLAEGDAKLLSAIKENLQLTAEQKAGLEASKQRIEQNLTGLGISQEQVRENIIRIVYRKAGQICQKCVVRGENLKEVRRLRADRILTSKAAGIPLMVALLIGIFYLTMVGANYPSGLLADGLFWLQDQLYMLCKALALPWWIRDPLVLGVYRTLAWVVSVMLPPMAIFFPLFTLLEDVGYLPRVAFNLDYQFQKCSACGKQALSMC